jgi:hypothetical protein
MYLAKYMSEEAIEALEKFIDCQPIQIVNQIYMMADHDEDKGVDYFTKMFMKVSDYARRNYGWIDERMDAVKVVYKKRKVSDPNEMSFMMGGLGSDCNCGSCGG